MKTLTRFFSLVLALSLVLPQPGLLAQNNIKPKTIHNELSQSIGRIKEVSQTNPDSKHVYIIEDAHTSIEAQRNIAQIIQQLSAEKNIQLIGLEGSDREISIPHAFDLMSLELKEDVCHYLMNRLRINGAEYAKINNPDLKLMGVENNQAYLNNLDLYQSTEETIRFQKNLISLRTSLKNIVRIALPKELKDFLLLKESYSSQKNTLEQYLKLLLKQAKKYGVKLNPSSELSKLESLLFSGNNTAINALALFDEISALEQNLKTKLAVNKDHKSLLDAYDFFSLIYKLSHYRLTRKRFIQLIENSDDIYRDFKKHTKVVEKQSKKLNLNKTSIYFSKQDVNLLINKAKQFYDVAIEREGWITKNLIHEMKQTSQNQALLVVGGFHSEGIKKALQKKGVSYTLIQPNISKLDPAAEIEYLRLMNSQLLPLEQFAINAPALSVPSKDYLRDLVSKQKADWLITLIALSLASERGDTVSERRLSGHLVQIAPELAIRRKGALKYPSIVSARSLGEGVVATELADDVDRPYIAVVGSGPTGIALARKLADEGAQVALFSSEIFPGGMVSAGSNRPVDPELRQFYSDTLALDNVEYYGGMRMPKYNFGGILSTMKFSAVIFADQVENSGEIKTPTEKSSQAVFYNFRRIVYYIDGKPFVASLNFQLGEHITLVSDGLLETEKAFLELLKFLKYRKEKVKSVKIISKSDPKVEIDTSLFSFDLSFEKRAYTSMKDIKFRQERIQDRGRVEDTSVIIADTVLLADNPEEGHLFTAATPLPYKESDEKTYLVRGSKKNYYVVGNSRNREINGFDEAQQEAGEAATAILGYLPPTGTLTPEERKHKRTRLRKKLWNADANGVDKEGLLILLEKLEELTSENALSHGRAVRAIERESNSEITDQLLELLPVELDFNLPKTKLESRLIKNHREALKALRENEFYSNMDVIEQLPIDWFVTLLVGIYIKSPTPLLNKVLEFRKGLQPLTGMSMTDIKKANKNAIAAAIRKKNGQRKGTDKLSELGLTRLIAQTSTLVEFIEYFESEAIKYFDRNKSPQTYPYTLFPELLSQQEFAQTVLLFFYLNYSRDNDEAVKAIQDRLKEKAADLRQGFARGPDEKFDSPDVIKRLNFENMQVIDNTLQSGHRLADRHTATLSRSEEKKLDGKEELGKLNKIVPYSYPSPELLYFIKTKKQLDEKKEDLLNRLSDLLDVSPDEIRNLNFGELISAAQEKHKESDTDLRALESLILSFSSYSMLVTDQDPERDELSKKTVNQILIEMDKAFRPESLLVVGPGTSAFQLISISEPGTKIIFVEPSPIMASLIVHYAKLLNRNGDIVVVPKRIQFLDEEDMAFFQSSNIGVATAFGVFNHLKYGKHREVGVSDLVDAVKDEGAVIVAYKAEDWNPNTSYHNSPEKAPLEDIKSASIDDDVVLITETSDAKKNISPKIQGQKAVRITIRKVRITTESAGRRVAATASSLGSTTIGISELSESRLFGIAS